MTIGTDAIGMASKLTLKCMDLERERDEAIRSCHIWQKGHAKLVEERDRWERLHHAAIAERDNALSDWRQADTDSIRALYERNEARSRFNEIDLCKNAQAPCKWSLTLIAERDAAIAERNALVEALEECRDDSVDE